MDIEQRLRSAANCLLDEYRGHFGPKARFDAQTRTLIAWTDRYQLRWQPRSKPDEPEGYLNEQHDKGVVRLEVIGGFAIQPN